VTIGLLAAAGDGAAAGGADRVSRVLDIEDQHGAVVADVGQDATVGREGLSPQDVRVAGQRDHLDRPGRVRDVPQLRLVVERDGGNGAAVRRDRGGGAALEEVALATERIWLFRSAC
jgi:hypothetical protein